jgi:hypothetical protein
VSGTGVCAIHQPNLFPRWVTLAKLLAADIWVVLDDVQFCRRDHQHRSRLGHPGERARQWLVLPVHLPRGRATTIREVRLADPEIARRRVAGLTRQYYRRTPGWERIEGVVDAVADAVDTVGLQQGLAAVAEASTSLLLRACGWRGEIVRSSVLARHGRSARSVPGGWPTSRRLPGAAPTCAGAEGAPICTPARSSGPAPLSSSSPCPTPSKDRSSS